MAPEVETALFSHRSGKSVQRSPPFR